MPRPAVQVKPSKASKLQTLNDKASELEGRLHGLVKADHNNDATVAAEANPLRMQLCEVLADMILHDAAYAVSVQAVARLWKNCFYARIQLLRTQLTRMQRKKLKEASSVEETLTFFLTESITLYVYMQDKLQDKLLDGVVSSNASGPTASQNSSTVASSTVATTTTVNKQGIVEVLHGIYMALGDLFRYSQSYSKAQNAYELAMTLGPGHGQAYNQLAVISQQSATAPTTPIPSALCLYYYARALLASHEPFATAQANLERLLDANRKWLKQQEKSGQQAGAMASPNTSNSNNAKLFLAHWVDWHGRVLEARAAWQQQNAHDNDQATDCYAHITLPSTESWLPQLHDLLKVSSLSDALLCKMVAVQAFAEHLVPVTRRATYHVGIALTDRVLQSLPKQHEKKKPSMRLLLPLALLTRYLLSKSLDNVVAAGAGGDDDDTDVELERTFWEQWVEIYNTLLPMVRAEIIALDGDSTGGTAVVPSEFEQLRGFVALPFFSQQAYMSVDEAIVFLRAKGHGGSSSASRQSANDSVASAVGSSGGGGGGGNASLNTQQGRVKVLALISLGELVADFSKAQISFAQYSDGKLALAGNGKAKKDMSTDEESYDDDVPVPMEDDSSREVSTKEKGEAGNDDEILFYAQPSSPNKPALLMPGKLLQAAAKAELESIAANAELTNQPPTVNTPSEPHTTSDDTATVTAVDAVAQQAAFTANNHVTLPPPPGFAMNAATLVNRTDTPMASKPAALVDMPIFQGDQWLYDTANPFNNEVYQPPPPLNSVFAHNDDGLWPCSDRDDQGMSLLDAGLLHSLFGDSPEKTKNPFAF